MSPVNESAGKPQITIVGGGIAGLVAAIACAEEGASVRLRRGSREPRRTGPQHRRSVQGESRPARDVQRRRLLEVDARARHAPCPHAAPRLTGARLRLGGTLRRTPPLGALPAILRLRGREAPVATDFRTWVASHTDDATAAMLSSGAGVFTFHHDPGELSAAFVWPRMVRLLLTAPSIVRYPVGGWSTLVGSLERRVRELGVTVETGTRVEELPATPVIVATELDQARELLGDDSSALAERPHGLPGPRRALPPRRPDDRLRPGRVGLDRALFRRQPDRSPPTARS